MVPVGLRTGAPGVRIPRLARRSGAAIGGLLVFLLVWVGLALLIAAGLIRFFWGEITVGQMLLNLVSVETDGGGGALVWICILGIGVLPLLMTAGVTLFMRLRRRRPRPNQPRDQGWRSPWLMRAVSSALAASVVVLGTASFATAVGLADYIDAGNSEYDLADYYVQPRITDEEQKRNLVLIYLESGEAAFEDETRFEKDAFAPLKAVTEPAQGWESVENLQQYEGGGWTMSGLTATQCGIPLAGVTSAASSGVLEELREGDDTYLDGTTCLGDLLEDHGYTNVFLGGASSTFAEKDIFLGSHGYSSVKGLDDWRAAGEPESSFRSDWGLSDQRLMSQAKDEVDKLHAESQRTGEPFNLSLLTLDTHEPVHVFDYCDVDTQEEATSVFACSMVQVAGFVEHLEDQGYLEDTAVVIMGDHLKPVNAGDAFQEQLEEHPNRTIFNRIWVPGEDQDRTLRADMDQLSMYPTLVEAAGLTLADREAGLGVSGFSPAVPVDSAQSLSPEAYSELLRSRSPEFYSEAWSSQPSTG
ncbi:LTA synthase family protein [Nesterenkonia sandarakina]|uniref:Phosphoglycerol transferase n=1 Tax=Nesterenkonia sandarakina TaxID=272918 RepID=A0A2T0YQH8_9MICC|nr:LTA synthase family protein [Nesterenkonia sandarakina]PRZ17459.1 phosphoglycerol transferase [Nesterenkonia sandarakina]